MKLNEQVYLTSDHHFGHQKMVDWGYREWGWEEQAILEWNKVIRPNDTVLHLGDLFFGSSERAGNWLRRLMGHKYLILGNHDRFGEQIYNDFGFTVIPPSLFQYKLAIPTPPNKDQEYTFENILFTHRPILDLPKGWWNYHGHSHGNKIKQIHGLSDHHVDCGVDVWGLKPRKIVDIYNYIKINQAKNLMSD